MRHNMQSSLKVFLSLLIGASSIAGAAETVKNPIPTWRGFYAGALTGGGHSSFKNRTYAQGGSELSPVQSHAVNVSGDQRLNPGAYIAGIGAGYNWQHGVFVFGVDTDFQSLSINDSEYTDAVLYPAGTNQFVLTTYGSANWLFTLRPKIGLATSKGLLYTTAGLGLTFLQSDFLFVSDSGATSTKRVRRFEPGFVLGAGFETGLTRNFSMKLEYLFTDFGKATARDMNGNIAADQIFRNTSTLKQNLVRIGVNYHLDGDLSPQVLPALIDANDWHVEMGVRPFVSTGVDGAPQPLLNTANSRLASRLIFRDLDAASLDVFGRIDHVDGFFAKGSLGAGTVLRGYLNDEDFPAGGAYSNTLSDVLGNLAYANIDFGMSFIREPNSNAGAFIGYSYYDQNYDAYDCSQLAGAGVCSNSSTFDNFMGISQADTYKSMRLGLTSSFNMTNRLKLTSEAAYLPFVNMRGIDYHNARQLIIPERSGRGDGSMVESILSYQLADNWDVGVGARYWMWVTRDGQAEFDFLGTVGDSHEPARYNARRYGGFVQLSYHDKPARPLNSYEQSVDWTGLYVGVGFAGTWGENNWPDPFGSTPGTGGRTNIAGFGGQIYATGPAGQINATYNWQTRNNIVLGIEGTAGIQDMRGDDTLFSGIGGVNGQVNSRYMATLLARVGVTLNRTLFYVDAGPAWLNTKYIVNGNTSAQTLGREYDSTTDMGYAFGGGVEYAFNKRWTTTVGYDHIRISQIKLSYPNITTINTQDYRVNQTMNVFKVAVNYKIC